MRRLIEFQTESGTGCVLVEVREEESDTLERTQVARGEAVLQKAGHSFEKAMGTICPIVDTFKRAIDSIASKPDELSMKFGLKFTGQAGAVLASTSVEGQCEVMVRWERER